MTTTTEKKFQISLHVDETRFGATAPLHFNDITCVLYFKKPSPCLVSSQFESEIFIYDLVTAKCLKKLRNHKKGVIHLIKWDETTFLSCSYDSTIYAFSVVRPYKKIKDFLFSKNYEVYRLLKLDKTHFLYCNEANEIVIVNFAENKITKKLRKVSTFFGTKLEKSLLFENCFYFNSNAKTKEFQKPVIFMDYEKNEILENFPNSRKVFSITVFNTMKFSVDQKKFQEILIFGGKEKILYIYNFGNKKICDGNERILLSKLELDGCPFSSFILGNVYLFLGNNDGMLHLFHNEEILIKVAASSVSDESSSINDTSNSSNNSTSHHSNSNSKLAADSISNSKSFSHTSSNDKNMKKKNEEEMKEIKKIKNSIANEDEKEKVRRRFSWIQKWEIHQYRINNLIYFKNSERKNRITVISCSEDGKILLLNSNIVLAEPKDPKNMKKKEELESTEINDDNNKKEEELEGEGEEEENEKLERVLNEFL